MSEFIVQATLNRKLWHEFRPLCWRMKKRPEAMAVELIERFVREQRRRERLLKGRV